MANVFQVVPGFEGVPADVRRALLVASNGTFSLKRLVVNGQALIEAVTKHGPGWSDDGLTEYTEGLRLGFGEKVPWTLVQQTITFFKAVYGQYRSEAIVLLWYAPAAPEGARWQVMAPAQQVNGSRLKSDDPGPAPAGWLLAGDIHSHGSHSAFHSGTDDRDEDKKDGIHITIGGMDSPMSSFSVSVVVDGTRFKLDLSDVVEGIPTIEFPTEWLARVSELPEPELVAIPSVTNLAAHRAVQTYVRPATKRSAKGGGHGRS